MRHSSTSSITHSLRERAAQVQRGGARAAVLGVNDGLVSTLCIVVGVAAAGGSAKVVLTAGLAGLLAGAISMAAGEWISVKSQVELFGGVLKDIRTSIRSSHRDVMIDNLAHTLAKYGMNIDIAHAAAHNISESDRDFADIYATQVVGINRYELGSPWRAAVASFVLFTVGSLVPLSVWFMVSGRSATVLAVIFTSLGGLLVGGWIARLSGKNIAYGATRQLLIIIGSAVVTYGIGYTFGVAIS